MYDEKLEQLIDAALADGELTEKEKQVLFKKAQALGVDLDEFEMVLDARLVKLQKAEAEKAASSAPKSNKYGDVKKCPVCGAIVPQLTGQCKECGYEFSNVDTAITNKLRDEIAKISEEATAKKNELAKSGVLSAEKKAGDIYSPLEDAQNNIDWDADSRIHELVMATPIPNTKNDLYDFISFLKIKGYDKKHEESIKKASLLFPDDPIFASIIDEENEKKMLKEKKEQENKAKAKRNRIGCLIIFVIIAALIIVKFVLK